MATNKSKKHKMTHPTIDWDEAAGGLNSTPVAKEYTLPYSDAKPKGKQYGMRITVNAFHQLLKGALRTHEGQKAPSVRYVEFSKASIFRVLSQPGCEYIRFYFVYPEKAQMSLVLEGLDANVQALKLESHVMKMAAGGKARVADEEDDPGYEEVGSGGEAFGGGGGGAPASPASVSSTSRKAAAKAKSATAAEQESLLSLLKAINTGKGE